MASNKNPAWARDELILALHLYIQAGKKQLDATNPSVVELSDLLRRLNISKQIRLAPTFRNPNGVSMKLANFMRLDPQQAGAGLTRGNQMEREIWDEFVDRPAALSAAAAKIAGRADQMPRD